MSEIYEGNSITVNNINKSKAKIKIRGGSRQATRSGKNVINEKTTPTASYSSVGNDDWVTIEYTNTAETGDAFCNFFSKLTKELKADTYYSIICEIKSVTTTASGYLSITNNDTSFAFPTTIPNKRLVELKAGDIIINKLKTRSDLSGVTGLLRTFVAVNPKSSVKIVFRLSVIEGDVTADSFKYEGYGVSPSVEFLSKIENVGDKINILNKDVVNATNNLRSNVLETGRRLIANNAGNCTYGAFKLGGRELLGETLGVHADIKTSSGNPRISIFAGNSSSLTKSLLGVVLSTSGTGYITLPSSLSDDLDTISAVLYVTTDTSVVAGTYVEYTNLKVQVGDGEVIYSDYKKANIQITICNENYGNAELLYNQMSDFYSAGVRKEIVDNKNCIVFNNALFMGSKGFSGLHFNYKKNTQYIIRGKFRIYDTTITSGGNLWVNAFNKDNLSIGYSMAQAKGSEWIQFSFLTNANSSFDHIAFSYGTSAYWCLDMDSLEIYEGVSVRTVPKSQVQMIIFPFEEGQKMYEGSYLAEDVIHNKRRQKEFSGAKEERFEINTNYSTESMLVAQILVNDMKTGTQNIISNYFSYNSITKTGTIRAAGNYLLFGLDKSTFPDIETFKTFLAQKKAEENPVLVEYELAEEEIIPYTQKQKNAFYQLQNILLYDGINYISVDDDLENMSIEVSKIIEDYETYISSNGFFINSQNDIHYLIDFSESEVPCMAEATETTVKAAGRNGDIVLSTTYDPNNFNIVCYTEDNLTQEEKVKEEMKLKKLLNSIKNKTIPLAFEKDDKFYKVKYSGAFSSTNFPKHLKFSIPLKTSESYGKDLIKKVIFGNGEETSDTFEDVGAIFTIKGPANSPIISLNDYSIEYDNPLLEGDKLIINSSNSTITHINSDGVKTNAMRYYNHQFPKIENGKNVLKVLSGVNEANVSVEWYDYKF